MKSHLVVADTSNSPYARLKPAYINAVELKDEFWKPKIVQVSRVTLYTQLEQLETSGRIDNFRRVGANPGLPFRGLHFDESDVYKWIEAAAYALERTPDPKLEGELRRLLDLVLAAQQADGYLSAYFVGEMAAQRFTNLVDMHELYCAGHLIQAAIALFRTGLDEKLMAAARRYADLIVRTFGPHGELAQATDGHPEIEMALVELYRATGERAYLEQAMRFIDMRGHGYLKGEAYYQDHVPFRELRKVAGHAVRAVYLNAGAADLYAESGEAQLLEALKAQWEHMTCTQEYVTGGIGARHKGEAFGEDYELPNEDAYAETCAAIGKIYWAWRMFLITGEAQYVDNLETTLYNAALVGIGLDGSSYNYHNPLACGTAHQRQPWFKVSCCPPNIARLLTSLPGYFYAVDEGGVWVNLYGSNSAELELPDGKRIVLEQESRYPWDGTIELRVQTDLEFGLRLRIPAWCRQAPVIRLNGERVDAEAAPGSYVRLQRRWQAGDAIRLELEMPARKMVSSPHVAANRGRLAIARGPLVYCFEHADQPGIDLIQTAIHDDAPIEASFQADLLNGVVALSLPGVDISPQEEMKCLYATLDPSANEQTPRTATLKAIPYYGWGNRDAGQMQVWMLRAF